MLSPGYKTTEFWLSVASTVVGAAVSIFSHIESPVAQVIVTVAGVLGSVLTTLGYQKSRTDVKVNDNAVSAVP